MKVYSADRSAKNLMQYNAELKQAIIKEFGKNLYSSDGVPDFAKFSELVFNNVERLNALNKLIHPATINDFNNWCNHIPSDYPFHFILKEAAILFEAGTFKDMDAIIMVYAPKKERIRRVMERDHVSETSVLARMNNQWSDGDKIIASDYLLINDGKKEIESQVKKLIQELTLKFESA